MASTAEMGRGVDWNEQPPRLPTATPPEGRTESRRFISKRRKQFPEPKRKVETAVLQSDSGLDLDFTGPFFLSPMLHSFPSKQ